MSLPNVVKRVGSIAALVALPVIAFAQEAVIIGTISDQTGGVLPGVTVTAQHEATGNTFVAVATSVATTGFPSVSACTG